MEYPERGRDKEKQTSESDGCTLKNKSVFECHATKHPKPAEESTISRYLYSHLSISVRGNRIYVLHMVVTFIWSAKFR